MIDDQTKNNLIKHDFVFISRLGSGGFGTVIKVKHKISNQFFAIKKLNNRRNKDPENILREIQAIARLDNTNIISYKHSFIEDNELYLVMQYCSGGSLRDLLNTKGKLDLNYAVNVFLRLTHTFAFLHKRDFVHHDIKPDNILFHDDKIKISDFGTVNTSIGTIIYSAPEMLADDAPWDDPRIDIFSLGITFMECLIGEHPFSSIEDWNQRNLKIKNADFPIKNFPYWLQQLLLKACHFDPSARFQSMLEFHDAIKRRNIPQIIDYQIIKSNQLTEKLKMLIIGKRWQKAKIFIEQNENESIGFQIQKGKYYIGTNQLLKAKSTFEEVLKKDSSSLVEKNIAEIYLQLDEPSKAATILHSYISKHFNDIEAHNQLLYSYFLSDQWELGLNQTNHLRRLYPKEHIFINNKCLFELLLDKKPSEDWLFNESNPIGYYNYQLVIDGNFPKAFEVNDKEALKSKLLFHEFRFRNIHKSKNTISIEVNGEVIDTNKHIVSFGRKGYNFNTFHSFEGNQVSRRHFVILNQKNNVWLQDMSTKGTYINAQKVYNKAFLLGRCAVEFSIHQIYIKSDAVLLL